MHGCRLLRIPRSPRLTGRREADVRNTFQLPPHLQLGILKDASSQHAEGVDVVCVCFCCLQAQGSDTVAHTPTGVKASKGESGLAEFVRQNIDASLQWSDVQWLRKLTKLPVLLKGVMTKEDAVLAVKHGYPPWHTSVPGHPTRCSLVVHSSSVWMASLSRTTGLVS